MKRYRIIPTLLLHDEGMVKGKQFKNYRYVGDPINAVRIFNEKEVDELCILDISATAENRDPDYVWINEIASEAFMPVSYGGGLKNIDQVSRILHAGVEKVIFNAAAIENAKIVTYTAEKFGSSSTVVSMDVRWSGKHYEVYSHNGKKPVKLNAVDHAKHIEQLGAGEIILTNIDREGSYKGYDLTLIELVAHAVKVPVIINGGAKNVEHFKAAINAGASAVTAGSMFVFYGNLEGVLITYPVSPYLFKKEDINV